jgi:tight adherence protein C
MLQLSLDQASIPGFAGITAGLTVFFLLYAIYSPLRPTKQRTVAEDVFGENNSSALEETASRYGRGLLQNVIPSMPENLIPEASMKKYEKLLIVSGNPLKITPEELFVLQITLGIIGLVIGLAVTTVNSIPSIPLWALPLFFTGLCAFLPYAYHISLRDTRAKEVQKNLPEALDLLQVVISTGSTFQPALKKVTHQLNPSFLRDEFTRMHVELQAGATLESCMRSFARSNTSPEGKAFTSSIIQSQKLGADVTDTLERQAVLSRANHEARLEKMIARLQTTLMIPISGFMMPAFLIIFIAPTMATIGQALG